MQMKIFDIQQFAAIYNATSYTVISGTAQDDNITNGSYDEPDVASNVTIDGGAGYDYIVNRGNEVIINGNAGNDRIFNRNSNATIIGAEGDDTIENKGSNVTINGGVGNDVIVNNDVNASEVTINGNAGNDHIVNRGENVTITGGTGNDKIENQTHNVIINGGADNDSISNIGANVIIYGGDGNDIISSRDTGNVTIIGGTGEDAFYSYSSPEVIVYNVGDGNDTIYNFGTNDTLMISGADYKTTKNGAGVTIVQVGEGSITLTGLGDNTPIIQSNLEKIVVTMTSHYGGNNYNSNTSEMEDPDEDFSSIIATNNNSSGSSNTPSNDNNTSNNMGNNIINGDVIINNYYYNNTTSTNNTYVSNTYINNNIFVYESGSETLTNFNSNDTLNFAATYTDWAIAGNDLIINSAEGAVRITDAQNKLIEIADANGNVSAHIYWASNYEGAIDGRPYNGFEVLIGSDNFNNQIFACENGSSLWGGNGNSDDELYGNSGYDEYIYRYGNGKDNIFNAGAEDAVNLNGVYLEQIANAAITDDGVNLNFTDGGALNVNGQVETFILSGQRYGADYQNKTWFAK